MKKYIFLLISCLMTINTAQALKNTTPALKKCELINTSLEKLTIYDTNNKLLVKDLGMYGGKIHISANSFPITIKSSGYRTKVLQSSGCYTVWTDVFHSPWVLASQDWCDSGCE